MMEKMDKDLRSRNYIVDKMARENGDRDSAIKDLQNKVKDLENKSCDNENRLFTLNTDIESFKMNYQIFQRSVDGLKSKMDEYDEYGERIAQNERDIKGKFFYFHRFSTDIFAKLEKANRPVFEGKEGVDQGALDDMLDNWKKEMYAMFAKREDVEDLENRIKELEDSVKTMGETVTSTTNLANNNKEEIDKLKKQMDNKLDADLFDSEFAKLSEAIKNAGGDVSKVASTPGSNISTKDMNKLRDIMDKFPEFEKALEELKKKVDEKASKKELDQTEKDISEKYDNAVNKISDDLKALQDLLEQLSKDMDFLKASGGSGGGGGNPDFVIQVTNKIEKLEIKIGNLENELGQLRRAKAQTVQMPNNNMPTGSNIDESRVTDLEKQVDDLQNELKGFSNEIIKEIKNHQDQINGKADYNQLEELRDDLLSKIDELLRGFKQFADKNDTKKALKNLEKQLKNLYELVMSRLQPGSDEDDAMFSKKPLGGFSCAS